MYYNMTDNSVSGYAPENIANSFGVPEGWYSASALLSAIGITFVGVVFDERELKVINGNALLVKHTLYQLAGTEFRRISGVGMVGEGDRAEVFNDASNTASGNQSHAEGSNTTASGDHSHAEGRRTTASGDYSHAEGSNTTASGDHSHAEGSNTTASSRSQHVEGEYNRPDTAPDMYSRGKYIHIAGNGESDSNRSNAHTLDWNGVAWYQGRPQFGGNSQDDGAQTVMANGDAEIILKSPNGTLWGITVSDTGVLTVTTK